MVVEVGETKGHTACKERRARTLIILFSARGAGNPKGVRYLTGILQNPRRQLSAGLVVGALCLCPPARTHCQ